MQLCKRHKFDAALICKGAVLKMLLSAKEQISYTSVRSASADPEFTGAVLNEYEK